MTSRGSQTLAALLLAGVAVTGFGAGMKESHRMDPYTGTQPGADVTRTMPRETQPLAEVQPLLRATDLIDRPVVAAGTEQRGTIKDVCLNEGKDKVEFVAVEFKDHGDRYVQVPLSSLLLSDRNQLVCDLKADEIGTLPHIAKSEWPKGFEDRRLSHWIGFNVRDIEDRAVGEIEDVLIQTESGALSEATLGVGGFLGFGTKLASVPWEGLSFPMNTDYARITMREDEISAVAYRPREYWQRLGFEGEQREREREKRNIERPVERPTEDSSSEVPDWLRGY
jgi:sporulation protein YlmC with PRC-barrel domain